jgi:site-specific DNA recombinase
MKQLEQFKSFAKQRKTDKMRTSKQAVIYSRVSTKEQAETNQSLETQKKYCEEYAEKNGYNVIEFFGGTYESAKNDERKEFLKMMQFIKNAKKNISHVLIYSMDRFSRSGANAIYILEQLLKQGIRILPVTQPVDSSTPEGQMQQTLQLMFSQYDNTNRKNKIVSGMIEKLKKGYYPTKAPIGYDQISIRGEQKITINEKGKFIKQAFTWKAKQAMSAVEISERLKNQGFVINHKRLTDILRNPFYCGIITHALLDGECYEGKHPSIISKELFFEANEIMKKNPKTQSHKKESNELPLRRFIKCDECGTIWVGYRVKKKNIWYYKCNKKGCACNRNAEKLHEEFSQLLLQFSFNPELSRLLTKRLVKKYSSLIDEKQKEQSGVKMQIANLKNKIITIEERFALAEIEREMYLKFKEKYTNELEEISHNHIDCDLEKSNLEKMIDYAIKASQNLHQSWNAGDLNTRQRIQQLVFPKGISYNHKKGYYRTDEMNSAFAQFREIASETTKEKNNPLPLLIDNSPLVVPAGIEPAFKV